MKRSTVTWIVTGSLAAAIGVVFLLKRSGATEDERLAQVQLKLAHAEGLPTTAAEFTATIPAAPPLENAAPLYRKLHAAMPSDKKSDTAMSRLLTSLPFDPSPQAKTRAEEILGKYKPVLDLTDQAAALPRCWFDRNWSDGLAVLFPEFPDIITASKALALRATFESNEGRTAASIADIQRIFTLTRHLDEEPNEITRMVGDRLFSTGIRQLTYCTFTHPGIDAYRQALRRAIANMPRPNLKDEHRMDLYSMLEFIDLCATPEGRAKIGLREEDLPSGPSIIGFFAPSHPRASIIEAGRRIWAAYDLPADQVQAQVDAATMDQLQALLAYPIAAKVYTSLTGGTGDVTQRLKDNEARRQEYEAALRALAGRDPAKTIRTKDLLSPFDKSPLTYLFDGKQITISVGGY